MGKVVTEALVFLIGTKVDESAGPDACHPWCGTISRTQPIIWHTLTCFYPRRVLFEAKHGPLKPAERVHMRCKTPGCVNVAHMMGGFENYFHAQVDRSGGPDACWPWTGMLSKGYGRFGTRHAVRFLAHRVAYEIANGPIVGHVFMDPEKEKIVMHTCDNPPCCNPKHLRLGTDADNIHDAMSKGRMAWQRRSLSESGGSHG